MQKTGPAIAILIVVASVLNAAADQELLPGHSHYGEAFNRGPRQSAYLMGGTGNVHFPVSSKVPLVQKYIEQGIGQLHGFWYREAERSFRQAARLDPNCGIAYWGMAQAAIMNKPRAAQFAAEALKHKAGLTERERMYLDALSDGSGYRKLIAKYPDDLEAKAFEVWRRWHLAEAGGSQPDNLEEAIALAREILQVDPLHPIHHAVIHFADSTKAFRRGLDSAAKCGEAAPSIGHMWHMPTHVYANLKRYPLAAWQLEACLRTNNARAMHDHVMPYEIELYAHNNEWLIRTLMHLGRVNDARKLAKEMIDLPRHPLSNRLEPESEIPNLDSSSRSFDPTDATPRDAQESPAPDDVEKNQAKRPKRKNDSSADESARDQTRESHGTAAYYGRERLMQLLRRYELWDELIDDCQSGYLEATRLPAEQGKYHANLGVAYYCRADVAKGDQELAALHKLLDEQTTLRRTSIEEANGRPEIERASALGAVEKRFGRPLASLQAQTRQLQDHRRIVTGFFLSRNRLAIYLTCLAIGEAVVLWSLRRKLMRAALSGMAAAVLGGWLISCHIALMNLASDSTNVDFAIVTQKQLAEGDFDLAESSARQFATDRPQQVRPQANLVEVLYKVGNTNEARREFEKLRALAGLADLDSPPLARLAPIAKEFGYPTDWRKPETIKERLSDRRPLPSLGPFEWRPWPAPSWKLTDSAGHPHELSEFHGKPVVLVFFLGRGCLHCQQQLADFAKKAVEFKEAGLTVIAVSTDDGAGIKKSLADLAAGDRQFPFLMLADPKLDVFRSYGAFDDFEQIALHGTYLIDGEGRVRWNDVSFEPFMNVEFFLTEAKRLLARPVAPVEPDARVLARK
jgi:peroxiredoxin/tetratricopeptide (TPR) repeat protein